MTLLDADTDVTADAIGLMNSYPGVVVDLYQFSRMVAFNGGPLEFQVANDSESNTRLRFTLSFTDKVGKRHTVTSRYYHRLLFQAADLENKAIEARGKAHGRRKGAGDLENLPLFASKEGVIL
jgi:hypothetical protein